MSGCACRGQWVLVREKDGRGGSVEVQRRTGYGGSLVTEQHREDGPTGIGERDERGRCACVHMCVCWGCT